MDTQELDEYVPAFKAVVLEHIRTRLGMPEWIRFRLLARQGKPVTRDEIPPERYSPETLMLRVDSPNLSVNETLIPVLRDKAEEIGVIATQPVLYVQGEGIYLWGLTPDANLSLSLWLTWPAQPPSW